MTLYEYYTGSYVVPGGNVYGINHYAQTFTVGNTGTNENFNITGAGTFGYFWESVPVDTLYVSIKNVDGTGKPSGSDLSTGSMQILDYEGWKFVTMSSYTLTASTKYALVCRSPDGNSGSGELNWYSNTSNVYGGGSIYKSTDSGTTWNSGSTGDFLFQILGTASSTGSTYNTYLTNSMTLTDTIYKQKYTGSTYNVYKTDSFTLTDTIYNQKTTTSTYNVYRTDSAVLTDIAYKQIVSGGTQGSINKDTMWINNNGTWVEFDHYDYFKIKKVQNQVSEFEVKIFDISPTQKLYFKEQAKVLFFCGTAMVLKGRIQTIEYGDAYEVIARGFGMEVKLLDKELIVSGDNRVQYDNTSAKSIVTEINSNILTTASSGLFATDYGLISLRFEYANRLNALGKTCEAIDYNWWVSQTSTDGYNTNYLNVNATQGSTSSVKTFSMTSNATEISQEKDINSLVNYVYCLGMGDGINQLATSVYAASTQNSFLNANIESTNSTITCSSIIPFNNTGNVRIAEEIINYTGKVTASATLTGCTRGISSSAKSHYKNCYIEQYYPTSSAQTGSSIQIYGLMDHTLIDKTIINKELLEVIASGYLSDRKSPIVNINITSDEPLTDATLNIGDMVTVTASESNVDGTYHIVKQEYNSNYGVLDMTTEVSNRSLEFIEQMQKSKEESESIAKYMQGATNIYAISESENLDNDHPLNLTFFVPEQAVAINSVKLNFKQQGWRSYGVNEIYEEDLLEPKTIISIGEEDAENLTNVTYSGIVSSATTSTLTDTTSAWTTNSFNDYVVKITSGTATDQMKVIGSNSATVLYLEYPWDIIPNTSSNYAIVVPYTSNQSNLDITDEVDIIGRNKWINVKFENAGGNPQGANYTISSGNLVDNIYSDTNWEGQQFTVGPANFDLKSIKIRSKKDTGEDPKIGILNVSAINASGFPTGSILTSGTYDGNTLTTTFAEIEFNLSPIIRLSGSTKYCFYLVGGTTSASAQDWHVNMGFSPPYTGGDAIKYTGSWNTHYVDTLWMWFELRGKDSGKMRIESNAYIQTFLESK